MNRSIAFLLITLLSCSAFAEAKRPKIVGIAHVTYASHDLAASRAFYGGWLGFDDVSAGMGDGAGSALFKVNDHQFLALKPESAPGTDRFEEVAFETNDAEAMRLYLAGKSVAVPHELTHDPAGNAAFSIKDPAGHPVEFVQYVPGSKIAQDYRKHLSPERVSTHLTHTGLIVTDLKPEYKFYTEVLGFTETWRGSSDGRSLSWINLKSPDGTDYVEFMLYTSMPDPTKRGSAHHICLVVPSVPKAVAMLRAKPYASAYGKPLDADHVGKNRKRQANLFDPDGTRVELMEANTVDGTVTPSSAAPWPPRE